MVRGKSWRKANGEPKQWANYFYWHPDCWLQEGKSKLNELPRDVYVLNSVERETRLRLVQKHARLKQRIKEARLEGKSHLVDKLKDKLLGVHIPIAKFGGIPRSWIKDMDI